MLDTLDAVLSRLQNMDEKPKEELIKLAFEQTKDLKIIPNTGQQTKAYFSKADIILYGGSGGGGKATAIDTPIATPTGWVNMEDISVGDTVFGSDGAPTKVTAVTEIMLDRPCYEVVFDDGAKIVADENHQWVTYDHNELNALTRLNDTWRANRRAKRPSKAKGTKSEAFTASLTARNSARVKKVKLAPTGTVRTTAEIAATLKYSKRNSNNHAVLTAQPLVLEAKPFILSPYLLGVWLGDGGKASGVIACHPDDEPHILGAFRAEGFKVTHNANSPFAWSVLALRPFLRELGVFDDKHVPREYLRASKEQRLALLQGLMDTDGTVSHSGGAEFCNTNEALVDAVVELAVSLGWKISKREGRATLYGKDCGAKWTCKFTPTEIVFRLPRKAKLQRIATRRTTKFRYIVACTPVPSVPVKCIEVAAEDHLYLAGKAMVPTHNSYLSIALAIQRHFKSIIFRRESTQTDGLIANAKEVILEDASFNGTANEFNWADGRSLKFAGLPSADDWRKHAGRERDLMVFDEAAEFLEVQVSSLFAWNRGPTGVHCQVLLASNPPRTADGAWMRIWFAPWLDPKYPNPAQDGELRWAVFRAGQIRWTDGPADVEIDGEFIKPKSLTFVRALLKDNPYRDTPEYRASLQALPDTLRKQMLHGDFEAGEEDDAFQTIPTSWVREAQQRWTPVPPVGVPMCAMGVDVAQGGADTTVLAPRYDGWYPRLTVKPGTETPDGKSVAGLVVTKRRDQARIIIDIGGGWGGDAYATLKQNNIDTVSYMGVKPSLRRTVDKQLKFFNTRAEAYWRFREALDPSQAQGSPIMLPDDPELVADLCAPAYTIEARGIKVEPKDKVTARLGRSPDKGDAVVMAWWDGAKQANHEGGWSGVKSALPRVNVGRVGSRRR